MHEEQRIWLKALGSSEERLPPNWVDGGSPLLRSIRFPAGRVPTLEVDDLVIYYAAGWQKIFAAAQVKQRPKHRPQGHSRWPWEAKVDVFLLVPDLGFAPDVRRAGINTLSLRNKSHIRLTEKQYREAVAGLAEAAGLDGERYAALAG
jgi:hypothetical protein